MKSFNKWYLDSETDILIQKPILVSSINTVVKQNKVTTNSIFKINDCNSICEFLNMRNIKIRQGYITQVDEHANKLITHLKSVCDLNNIKNVIEIGFLAGHSAELFLKLNSHVNVTSIDDGALQSVSAGKEFINNVLKNKGWMKYWTEEVSNATADLVSSGFITNLHNIDIDIGRGTVICKYV